MEGLKPHLLASPSVLMKTWTQERIIAITTALSKYRVCSRNEFIEALAVDSKFLLEPLSLWVKKNQHSVLLEVWRKIVDIYVNNSK